MTAEPAELPPVVLEAEQLPSEAALAQVHEQLERLAVLSRLRLALALFDRREVSRA